MKGYPLARSDAQFFEDIEALELTGNMTPLGWFQHLLYREGRFAGQPHLAAITLLSEIVYWYRPIIEIDPQTRTVKSYRKRFQADLLQYSQQSFANKFNFSYKQAKDAFDFLDGEGVIFKDLRQSVEIENGKLLGNVLYVGLDLEKLKEISTPLPESDRGSAPVRQRALSQSGGAYTENTDRDYEQRNSPLKKKSSGVGGARQVIDNPTNGTRTEKFSKSQNEIEDDGPPDNYDFNDTWGLNQ